MFSDELDKCPNCGSKEIWRDSVDIGVGVMHGPYGCAECLWSEDSEYDKSENRKHESEFDDKGGMIDQYGSYYPPRNLIAKACFAAYLKDCEEKGIQPVLRKSARTLLKEKGLDNKADMI